MNSATGAERPSRLISTAVRGRAPSPSVLAVVIASLMAVFPLAAASAQGAEFRVDGATLHLDGPITAGDDRTFAHYLDSTAGLKRVSISSPGGDLATGLKIGEIVRARGLSTFVEAGVREASSAAAYIFMGGVEREVKGGRGVGVHAFYTPRNDLLRMTRQKSGDELLDALTEFERRAQEGTMAVVEYVTRMTGDTRILHEAVKTGSATMVWPAAAQLAEWKVATKVTPIEPDEIPNLEWLLGEVLVELGEWLDPTRVDALDDDGLDRLEGYLSDDASVERLRETLAAALARLEPPSRTVARTRIVAPIVASLVEQLRDPPLSEQREGG